ncbi:glycosyl hydrolase 115 family protein [Oxalobacteraceae bacterium A2-2]
MPIFWRPALLLALLAGPAHAATIALSGPQGAATVLAEDDATMRLAADLLRRDLKAVAGREVRTITRLDDCARVCIVIGRHDAPLLRQLAQREQLDFAPLQGEWERYVRTVATPKGKPGTQLLVIAGSDARGAIYGVVDLTRDLGVSAWEWWADVTPTARSKVEVSAARIVSQRPSVRYRGIFLNDEDWGLQPWAARTHDPVHDIGPTTYARIFELLWRLKANTIWPAMHDSTKPFYQIEGNARTASEYAIVVGTSHAEPMMRNNVREWQKSDGAFNFFTNRDALVRYWEQRVHEVKDHENIYSVGIRGVHDSAMEGATTVDQAREGVAGVIDIQRGLLSRATGKPPAQVPQALTVYKEVLDIYNSGLQLPDDITLVWPDDNYGYLHQLSTPAEARRGGGAGIYYHLSYWGRPHDYLWLATTHPGLVRDQLQRAAATGSDRLWIANVGDIKPGEYLTQYFLDLAFDHRLLGQGARQHLQAWTAIQFGQRQAGAIADILQEYYDLAWERRPEFMGFSQTEPTTPTRQTDYLQSGGEEAEQRLARYQALTLRAQAVAADLPAERQDAYYQLVLYPVRAAASLNTRILKLDLAAQYARMGRPSAQLYARQAQAAQDAIAADTAHYNALKGGKWRAMMDAAPRRLPVFLPPLFPSYGKPARSDCGLAYPTPLSAQGATLAYTSGRPETKTLTVIQYGATPLDWSASAPAGLGLSASGGKLEEANGYEQRIDVRYDGKGAVTPLRIRCGAAQLQVKVQLAPGAPDGLATEHESIITLPAATASASAGWSAIDVGSFGTAMRSDLSLPSRDAAQAEAAPALRYAFQSNSKGAARLKIVAVPVHPLTAGNQLRIAVRIDQQPWQVLDYATHGRSDEWKNNVLSNAAVRTLALPDLPPGRHQLAIHALDPGFVLDRVEISYDGAPVYYGKAALR